MDKEKALETTISKVIEILSEESIKIRRLELIGTDDWRYSGRWAMKGCCYVDISNNGEVGFAFVNMKYDSFGERGKQLKKKKNDFLKYFNVKVTDDYIRFTYTTKELTIESMDSNNNLDDTKIESVMKKIEKLLSLAGSDNEHESISASLMAQKLLKKYNLEIEQITGKEKEEEIERLSYSVNTGNKWKYRLASIVANNYCCKVYVNGNTELIFYGYRSDIVIARRIFAYLFDVGCKLAKSYANNVRKENNEYDDMMGCLRSGAKGVYNSFCMGFARGVEEHLSKQCTALMLTVPQKVEESYNDMFKGCKSVSGKISTNDLKAYNRGMAEGKRALNNQYITQKE